MDPSHHRPEPQAIPERGARVVVAAVVSALIGALLAGSGVFLWQAARIQSLQSAVADADNATKNAISQVTGLQQQITDLQAQVTHQEKKASKEKKAAKEAKQEAKTASEADNGIGDLADGKWYGTLDAVNTKPDEIKVDVQQYFTGAEAQKEAKKDGKTIQDDSYVRNVSTDLRTLEVASGTAVDVLKENGGSPKHSTISFSDFASMFTNPTKDEKQLLSHGYWFWVEGGRVTKIEEQFAP